MNQFRITIMYSALDLVEKILLETKYPMTSDEIWDYAIKKGYDKNTNLKGKTPGRTIGAQLYTNVKEERSKFIKTTTNPTRFGLKEVGYTDRIPLEEDEKSCSFTERDLHPLVVSYVAGEPHFHGHTKTIFHENSAKKKKNETKWMHPDLVSVHYPFDDLSDETVKLAKNTGQSGIMLYSFELKVSVDSSNVRECFFQAVSNSSWANEGYLVALEYTQDALNQLSRLSASFGIGVIRLDANDVHQSELLFPARTTEFPDLGLIDDLSSVNADFRSFIENINKSMNANGVFGKYDKVLDDEELKSHIMSKNIHR